MTDHRYDGSSIDLERALVRYMAERRISRRTLLTRIGTAGALVTLGPVVAACASTGSPSPAASLGAEPEPEAELFVYNWADYMGEDVVSSFEDKYGVKVTYDFFDNYDTMFARIGQSGGGYDVSFPASTDIPALLEQGLVQALDLSLIPNVANLGAEWADPAYDPGNKHSVPYMWWTTGVAYDTEQISDELTSWSALWDERWAGHISMLDDMREVFASALLQQGKDINTTDEGELDAALTLLKKQKPIVRTYTTDDIGVLSSGDAWIAHAWGADVYQVTPERPSVVYYIPEEGGVRGSDTAVLLANATHPIAAQLFLNHLLDAQVSASNTNYIGYMGPNAAAKEFIDPELLADPAVNPDSELVAKLQEILDIGTDLDKYTWRWNELRGA